MQRSLLSFQVGLQSFDGEVNQIISAKTSQKICDNPEDSGGNYHTGFLRTFCIHQFKERAEIIDKLRKFWELEHIGILSLKQEFTSDEESAWKKVSESRTFDRKRYQVEVPWKKGRPCLINNRPLAERRLQVERKLVKDKKVAAAY